MQIRNMVDVTSVLKEGLRCYKTSLKIFLKYAFLTVIVSETMFLYNAFLETFFDTNKIIYIVGVVFSLFLYFPFLYYLIRISIVTNGKLKSILEKTEYDFKDKFIESKEKFWRVFFILIVRFVLKVIAISSIGVVVFYSYNALNPEVLNLELNKLLIVPITCVSMVILFASVYLLIRLEFASIIVYWDIESKYSDFKTSYLLTRHQLYQKMKIMFVAHLPGLILSAISLAYLYYNLEDVQLSMRWLYILLTVLVNGILYSWLYAIYFPLLDYLKCFVKNDRKTIDEDGREWLSF